LKHEHAVIAETLNKVRGLGTSSKEGQETLLAAQAGLLAHLKKEDEQLYPVLRKEAESDPGLQHVLDTFASEMGAISKGALQFFAKYADGGSGIEFAKDFGQLFAKLSQRISKEENIIYARYDRLTQ
ncbi:MAG: hemerythrin domain-containing protein, partial [bacterium]|nr:hemerythrin domain-containing protein [bacterium]